MTNDTSVKNGTRTIATDEDFDRLYEEVEWPSTLTLSGLELKRGKVHLKAEGDVLIAVVPAGLKKSIRFVDRTTFGHYLATKATTTTPWSVRVERAPIESEEASDSKDA